jgi:sulfofructosephosphate aldolase
MRLFSRRQDHTGGGAQPARRSILMPTNEPNPRHINQESSVNSKMTTAEKRGYQQICDADGFMLVVAADQRGGMRKLLSNDPAEQAKIGTALLGRVKQDIVRHLANPAASCILLDPVCAVPSVINDGVLDRATGLLVGLDDSGWDTTPEGFRLSKLCAGVNARRVREMGGTGAKLMVYLRPDQDKANVENLKIISDTIEDFAREDLLLVVEILTYQLDGEDDAEYSRRFPALIVDCARLALDYGSKVLKMPFPGTAEACAEITRLCGDVPWAVLSAGVNHDTFISQVEVAMANGASGIIAGRSLWKDCISLDASVTAERLNLLAVPRLRELSALLARGGDRISKAA